MSVYKIGDDITLYFERIRSGARVTGLSVTVKVENALTGALLLPITPLVEIVPGIYSYNWVSGITTDIECIASYFEGVCQYADRFNLIDFDSGGGGSTSMGGCLIQAAVITNPQLAAVLNTSSQLVASIQPTDIGAIVSDPDAVVAAVETPETVGSVTDPSSLSADVSAATATATIDPEQLTGNMTEC